MAAFDASANPTLSSGYNDVTFAAWINDQILDEERPYNCCRPFFRYNGPEKSVAVDFPIQHDPGASATYTEGTGLSNTALTTDKATATAVVSGMACTVTDEVDETAVLSVPSQAMAVLGRSNAELFETDATALLDDFATTVGTAGIATTYETLIQATNKLAQNDQTGSPVGVLDPAQWGNVMRDLGTSGAAALARPDIAVGDAVATDLVAYGGFLAGAPWFQTSLVTSTGGGVFIDGVALGLYEIRSNRIETIRVPNLPGLEIVGTQRYGMVEIRDRAGVTLLSA